MPTKEEIALNKQVARALGWFIKKKKSKNPTYRYMYRWENKCGGTVHNAGGGFCGHGWCTEPPELPSWSTDDGLAFAELWPKICERADRAEIIYRLTERETVFTPVEWKYIRVVNGDGKGTIYSGETWARILCDAFLALCPLKGESDAEH